MISLIECEMVIGLIHNLQFELLIKGEELNLNEIEENSQIVSVSVIKEEIRKIDF